MVAIGIGEVMVDLELGDVFDRSIDEILEKALEDTRIVDGKEAVALEVCGHRAGRVCLKLRYGTGPYAHTVVLAHYYGFNPTPALREIEQHLDRRRIRAGEKIVEIFLEVETGAVVDIKFYNKEMVTDDELDMDDLSERVERAAYSPHDE